MGNRIWAILIKQSLLGIAVIFVAGALWDHFYNDPSSRAPLLTGSIAVAIYLVLIAIMGVLNAITGALYLWLFAERDISEGLC